MLQRIGCGPAAEQRLRVKQALRRRQIHLSDRLDFDSKPHKEICAKLLTVTIKCHIKAQQEKTTKCRNVLKFQLPTASKAGKKRHQKTPLARFGKDEVTSSTLVSSSTKDPLEFQGVLALEEFVATCGYLRFAKKSIKKSMTHEIVPGYFSLADEVRFYFLCYNYLG